LEKIKIKRNEKKITKIRGKNIGENKIKIKE
jgi:hypothetical protein